MTPFRFNDGNDRFWKKKFGETPWELHKRSRQGEFAPADRFDPIELLWMVSTGAEHLKQELPRESK